jgi:4-hydroxybenzoate polyprenyltransferase
MIWATIAVCIFLIVQTDFPALLLFAFTILFTYFFSIFDAYREAQLFNLRAEDQSIPKPRSDSQGRLMFGVFLAVVATVVLADKLDLFDMDWIYDWWPVPVLALGIYLIYAAVRDRGKERQGSLGAEESDEI